jgi:cysteinyl-tRNA synthetase
LVKIINVAEKIEIELSSALMDGSNPEFDFGHYYTLFESAMDDDFNSPKAIGVIFDFVRDVNTEFTKHDKINLQFYENAKKFLAQTAEGVFGILHFNDLKKAGSPSLENNLIELLIELRTKAKIEKNYQLSDEIREGLNKVGIILQDSKSGTTYKKQ